MPAVPDRPLADFRPRERLAAVPHTTRRFACRSVLALSPDARALAFVSDQGSGTFEAWTAPRAGGAPSRALSLEGGAVRSLCWTASGELVGARGHAAPRRYAARRGGLAGGWPSPRDHRRGERASLPRRARSVERRPRAHRRARVGHRARRVVGRRPRPDLVRERGRLLEAVLATRRSRPRARPAWRLQRPHPVERRIARGV